VGLVEKAAYRQIFTSFHFMRKHLIFIGITVLELALLTVLLVLSSNMVRTAGQRQMHGKSQLVTVLGLTDLSLWTEARYTRHPSQADFFTAFQDFPAAIEHFPAGSIVAPLPIEGFVEKNDANS
jgi:hypothetical protein